MTQKKALSGKDMGSNKISNMGDGAVATDAATKGQVDTAYSNAISRANHTGTQTASTISNFDTQVRTSRLDQMAVPTGPVSFNNQKLTTLADGTVATDAVTKGQLDTAIQGLVSGQTLKNTVRVASTTNVNLASPGTTVDGVTLANGDIFLATAQTTGSENGPYVFNGSAAAATRASNWDTQTEAVLGSYWIVREGSKGDNFALLTNDTFTLGTTAGTFSFISVAGASIGRYNQDIPATSAGATATITHNLNSTDVSVEVKRVGSPFDYVDVYVTTPTVNTVAITPDVAIAAGEYRVIVKY